MPFPSRQSTGEAASADTEAAASYLEYLAKMMKVAILKIILVDFLFFFYWYQNVVYFNTN